MNEKKKIVWHDKSEKVLLKSVIAGHFAMWSTRQSPYICPNNLDIGIKEFDRAISDVIHFDNVFGDYLTKTTYDKLKESICTAISKSKTIVSWSTAKKGTGPVFITRYTEPEPDYDFVDLDALARNIAQSVWLELCYGDGFFESQ